MKYLLFLLPICAFAQTSLNERGFDPRVDYEQLYDDTVSLGIPWDDRNLDLTLEDLAILPPTEFEDRQAIPVYFRVGLRRNLPQLRKSGSVQYPHSAVEVVRVFYGGLYRDGVFSADKGTGITVNSEVNITMNADSAESAIAINPVDPSKVIAGVNGPGGQNMYYSNDGGATWQFAQVLSGSCCDPTVDWSPDGTIAYVSTLGNCGFFTLCNIEIYTSTNNGQSWGNQVSITNTQVSDKQYLHVDHVPTSPHFGNLYVSWHDNNVLKFARSTNNGVSFDPIVTMTGPLGIGSDIASDRSGNVFHIWSSYASQTVRFAVSTDGGQTFSNDAVITTENSEFNYPIPCFDQRQVPIIVNATADTSTGSFQDRVYACWNDTRDPESTTPSQNHSQIWVAYSDDLGMNWNLVNPHPTADVGTVDRFNPWLEVDQDGTVHVIFYSTQNNPNRLEADIYHVASTDGGQNWSVPQRVTATSSNYINDSFQFGDYTGMSIVGNQMRPIWTDNRASVDVFTAEITTSGGGGDYVLVGPATTTAGCKNESLPDIEIQVNAVGGFTTPVSLTLGTLPSGITGSIVGSPVTPPGMAMVQLTTDGTVAGGMHAVSVQGDAFGLMHDVNVAVYVRETPLTDLLPDWLANFDPNYDFNGDGALDLIDFASLINCYE
ncbi:MAG: exo-alpha-sialidase [Acidobacteria bacterium]|nr:exo-alpha-sialidase [Acidobacteriota bacterium]